MKKYFNIWVLGTLSLYYLGPIPWSGQSSYTVLVLVVTSLALFNLGSIVGSNSKKEVWHFSGLAKLDNPKIAFLILIIYSVLFTIHLQMVSGRFLLDPSSWSLNFGEVYNSYVKTVTSRGPNSLTTYIFLVAKAILFPFFIYIFFRFYKEKPLLAFTVLFFFIASSFMRGTDKESIDAAFILIVAMYLHGDLKKVLLLGSVSAPVLLYLFIARKLGRFGGVYPDCLPESQVCFNYNSYWAETFGPSFEVGRVMLTNYITQGYQGLHLATNLPFDFNYGLGHLTPLKNAVCSLTGLACELNSYNIKLVEIGWNTEFRWVSAYTYLANDLSWMLVPLYFFLIGYIFSIAENQWQKKKTPSASVTIFLVALLFLYSSANMQIAISMDWVFTTILFLYIPLLRSFLTPKKFRI